MIGALKGIVATSKQTSVLIFAGPVGYNVYVCNKTKSELPPGKKILIYIHTHVRDDAIDLFGFLTQEELTLFELLLTVSGIGPKTALAVMDKSADAIIHAIQEADVDFFTTVPRLGKKNAQKIIIELKQKIGSLKELSLTDSADSETKQLVEALTDMGFAKAEIIEALRKLDEHDISIEQKLRHMLKLLG